MVVRALRARRHPSHIIHHKSAVSDTNTTTPVREYVIISITKSAAPMSRPTHRHTPPHPQQNGNAAQIAAAAWLGFAKPNPCRTKPLTVNSIILILDQVDKLVVLPYTYVWRAFLSHKESIKRDSSDFCSDDNVALSHSISRQ